jgi:predicted MFS family arabinose efflux permease
MQLRRRARLAERALVRANSRPIIGEVEGVTAQFTRRSKFEHGRDRIGVRAFGRTICYNIRVSKTADVTIDTRPGFKWDRMSASAALGYCVLVAALSVGSVLGELRSQFHISGFIAAMHGSTFGIGLLVAGCFGVSVVSRIGRRNALAGSAAVAMAGVTALCLGQSWPVTLGGATLGGFGGALLVMVMPGLISDHYGEHRAEAFAAVNGAPGLAGVAFSVAVGVALRSGHSWRWPYLLLALAFALALAFVAWPVPVPEATHTAPFSLALFRQRNVFVPWLYIVNAVLTEFTVGVWSATYLKEVGHASGGTAAAAAGVFGVSMFVSRHVLPQVRARLKGSTVPIGFVVVAVGALVMCLAPGVPLKTLGVVIVGLGGAPLYPLTVDRLYHRADHLDSVSLGAICALASGVAVMIGPVVMGLLADAFTLRWAILIVPVLAVVGAVTQRFAHVSD